MRRSFGWFLGLIACLLAISPAWASPSLVQTGSGNGSGSSHTDTMSGPITSGDYLVLCDNWGSSSVTGNAPTGGAGTTWTSLGLSEGNNLQGLHCWGRFATAGDSTTFTSNLSGNGGSGWDTIVQELSETGSVTHFTATWGGSTSVTTRATQVVNATNSNDTMFSVLGLQTSQTSGCTAPSAGWALDLYVPGHICSQVGPTTVAGNNYSTSYTFGSSSHTIDVIYEAVDQTPVTNPSLALLGVGGSSIVGATSTPTPTSTPMALVHIPTFVWDSATYGGMAQLPSDLNTWATYAETGPSGGPTFGKAYTDCGPTDVCWPVLYTDPGHVGDAGAYPDNTIYPPLATTEGAWVHINSNTGSKAARWAPSSCGQGGNCQSFNFGNTAALGNPSPFVAQIIRPNVGGENDHLIVFTDDTKTACGSKGMYASGQTYYPYEWSSTQADPGCSLGLLAGFKTYVNNMTWAGGKQIYSIVNGCAAGGSNWVAYSPYLTDDMGPGSALIGCYDERTVMSANFAPRHAWWAVNMASIMQNNCVGTSLPCFWVESAYDGSSAWGGTSPCTFASNFYMTGCGLNTERLLHIGLIWLMWPTTFQPNWSQNCPTCTGTLAPHPIGYFPVSQAYWRPSANTLIVFPEQTIYPSQPIQALNTFDPTQLTTNGSGCGANPGSGGIQSFVVSSACGNIGDGTTDAGVYVREFSACYNFGVLIGAGQCAVVMNTTGATVTPQAGWFTLTYDHSLTLTTSTSGGDVLTQGCSPTTGCPSSVINPLGATFTVGTTTVPRYSVMLLFHS